MLLAIFSALTNVAMVDPGDESWATVIIITIMVLISGILRFVQETRSGNVAAKLSEMIHTTVCVTREGEKKEIPLEEIVVGDIVSLSAGDMLPADVRILRAKDLFLSQSSLTGESEPVEKSGAVCQTVGSLTECGNLAFMGSTVVSGSATAVVLAVGHDTMLGAMAKALNVKPPKTTFEKGVNSVSWVLIRFMLLMVPIVLLINGLSDGDWIQAGLFAISIAVGLTPEMLPMIVTTSLAKGAMTMSREKVIIKDLNAIQNLGAMDILCTDKTGTLTQDKVVLEYHLNVDGDPDDRVLRHAFLNSYFQTGLKNLIDIAVIDKQRQLGADELIARFKKVDEIPFDFERRRMSVVVCDRKGKTQLVTKGAVEEMLACCTHAESKGKIVPLTDKVRAYVLRKADELNGGGMRVIAVAQKTNPAPEGQFSTADEKDMVLIGFLAFLDPPKETTRDAIHALREYGVGVKILTGDNEKVTCAICRQVGMNAERVLLGADIDAMDDEALAQAAEEITVFAKLSPAQKARVVTVLRQKGHSVGYMGDGINDAAAMKAADVGISVDTAVDIAKESASVVLLEKDLMVLEKGVIEGRKIYANMMKYIKMTAASNFGNMFSVLAASAFLPFLPMASLHLILLNLIYDISCTAIPCGVPQSAADVGCVGHQPLHALDGPGQFAVRHCDVPAAVFRDCADGVRRHDLRAADQPRDAGQVRRVVPDRLVHRIHVDADARHAHDSHEEAAVHPEPRVPAGDAADDARHRCRDAAALHAPRRAAGAVRAAACLLRLSGADCAGLHGLGNADEEAVYPQVS